MNFNFLEKARKFKKVYENTRKFMKILENLEKIYYKITSKSFSLNKHFYGKYGT